MRGLVNMSNSWIRTGDDWRPRTLIRQSYRWYTYTGTLYIIENYIDCAELTCYRYLAVYSLYHCILHWLCGTCAFHQPCIWPFVLYTFVHYTDCVVLTCSLYLVHCTLYHCTYFECVVLTRSISPVSGLIYSIPLYTTLIVWYLRVPSALYLALTL